MADSNFGKWFETVKAQREASAGGSSAAGADSGRGSGRSGLSSLAFWSSGDGDAGAGAGGGKDPESGGLLGSFSLSGRRSEEKKSMCGCCEMTRGQRMQSCVVLVLAGTALMAVALFLFLPFPTKFSLCFTVGSMMYMGAFAMLQGPSAYVRHLVSRDRWLFSSAYLGSMTLTLYAALYVGSTLLVIFASTVQVVALAWYGLSYIPGGSAGMKVAMAFFVRTARSLFWPCISGASKVCAACCKS